MLSVTPISVAMADNYYNHDNYYSAEKPGQWMDSKAAKALGLSGEITDQDWHRIVRGQNPRTGEQLVQNGVNGKHRAATDLTFSVPKSVSIAGLVGDRKDIIEAHRKAVDTTLRYVEQHGAQVRETHGCTTEFKKTKNLLVAKFEHGQSRENDCQLHTHTPAMNLTRMAKNKVRSISGYVFASEVSSQIDARNLLRAYFSAKEKAGLADVRFHDLRHTFATRLVQSGIDLYVVKELLGHKTITMTMRYAHHYPESLRHGVEVLDTLGAQKGAQSNEKGATANAVTP